MDPAPSGLQEVDGLNHLLESRHPDFRSGSRCTPRSPHRLRFPNYNKSISAPTDARPQNYFVRCANSAIRWCVVLPINHCSNRLIVTRGGIDKNKCMCSFATGPFHIFTSCCAQMSRIKSLARVPASPLSTALQYFVVNTICRWISSTACAPRRYCAILTLHPRRALKPSVTPHLACSHTDRHFLLKQFGALCRREIKHGKILPKWNYTISPESVKLFLRGP
jgi:hypothetical protein